MFGLFLTLLLYQIFPGLDIFFPFAGQKLRPVLRHVCKMRIIVV